MTEEYSREYTEQLILEQCRWLFNQDVRVITLLRNIPGTEASECGYSSELIVLVLPKHCTLWSLAQAHGSNEALIIAQQFDRTPYGPPRELVLDTLWQNVQARTAEIVGIGRNGKIQVQSSSLPEGYRESYPYFLSYGCILGRREWRESISRGFLGAEISPLSVIQPMRDLGSV